MTAQDRGSPQPDDPKQRQTLKPIQSRASPDANEKRASDASRDPPDAAALMHLIRDDLAELNFDYASDANIARHFISIIQGRGIDIVAAHDELHAFFKRQGIWLPLPEKALVGTLHQLDGAAIGSPGDSKGRGGVLHMSVTKARGILASVYIDTTIHDSEFFEKAKPGIVMQNGFVSVSTAGIDLEPFSPAHRARCRLDYPFPEGEIFIDDWRNFLLSLFRDDDDSDQKIDFLGEYVGACLVGMPTTFQKAAMLVGEGSNGKSTFLRVVERLFPPSSITSIPPECFEKEYYRARLRGSLINVCNELRETKILESASLKAVITGDRITGRQPCHEVFEFRPQAGHVFACNALPVVTDHSRGFFRRFVIIEFNRDFTADPEQRPDVAILEEMEALTPQIVAWALDGAVRLLQNGRYTIPPSHEAAAGNWMVNVNSVAAWLQEGVSGFGPGWEGSTTLYRNYVSWCEESGLLPVSQRKFALRLVELGVEKRTTSSGREYLVTPAIKPDNLFQ